MNTDKLALEEAQERPSTDPSSLDASFCQDKVPESFGDNPEVRIFAFDSNSQLRSELSPRFNKEYSSDKIKLQKCSDEIFFLQSLIQTLRTDNGILTKTKQEISAKYSKTKHKLHNLQREMEKLKTLKNAQEADIAHILNISRQDKLQIKSLQDKLEEATNSTKNTDFYSKSCLKINELTSQIDKLRLELDSRPPHRNFSECLKENTKNRSNSCVRKTDFNNSDKHLKVLRDLMELVGTENTHDLFPTIKLLKKAAGFVDKLKKMLNEFLNSKHGLTNKQTWKCIKKIMENYYNKTGKQVFYQVGENIEHARNCEGCQNIYTLIKSHLKLPQNTSKEDLELILSKAITY